jgi:hypothetical protein
MLEEHLLESGVGIRLERAPVLRTALRSKRRMA